MLHSFPHLLLAGFLVIPLSNPPQIQAQQQAPSTPETEQEATSQTAPIPVENTEALVAEEGSTITVSGEVEYVRRSGRITFINFKGDGDFSCVVFSDKLEAIELALGGSIRDSLQDKPITVSGKITLYKEKPQITITDAGQIGLEGAMPTTAGGGKSPVAKIPTPKEIYRAKDDRDLEDAYQLGATVGVTGKIKECSQNQSKSITILEFSSADFQAVIFSADLPKIRKALGHEDDKALMKALKGEKVMLIGKVDKYRENLQMTLKEATQIVLDPPKEDEKD